MKKNKLKYQTREEWLLAAITLMQPLFKDKGYTVPEIRVSCGWPSRGGLSAKKRTLGQAWCKSASSDKVGQIFISPYLNDTLDDYGVLPVTVHEVVHQVVGVEEGHNKNFGKCARAVGLEGKLTSTTPGEELLGKCKEWDKELGPYPHAKLDPRKSPVKKQSTRLIKCQCTESEYCVRITRKWLEEFGAPISPVNQKPMKFEIPDDLDFDGEDGDND